MRQLSFLFFLVAPFYALAEVPVECMPPAPMPATAEPPNCPAALIRIGEWNLQPVTNVTAFAQTSSRRAYNSTPLPVPSVSAEFPPEACEGKVSLIFTDSGRTLELAVANDGEESKDFLRLTGDTVINPALGLRGNAEIRASDPTTAMLSLQAKGARFAQAAGGGITFEMLYSGEQAEDTHPYCNCRTQLRAFIQEKTAFYESIVLGYQDTTLWFRPEGLNPKIEYDYVTYNQFQLMVHQRGLTPAFVTACFNARYDEMSVSEKETLYVASYFARKGRAGAATDNSSCDIRLISAGRASCFPEIMRDVALEHEVVHQNECARSRSLLDPRVQADFDWMAHTSEFEYPIAEPKNTQPQALAETELRAYAETIRLLNVWEAENCSAN